MTHHEQCVKELEERMELIKTPHKWPYATVKLMFTMTYDELENILNRDFNEWLNHNNYGLIAEITLDKIKFDYSTLKNKKMELVDENFIDLSPCSFVLVDNKKSKQISFYIRQY